MLANLDAREQVTGVYLRRQLPIDLGRTLGRTHAHAYVADPAHVQYAGKMASALAARIIAAGSGSMGTNRDYFESTEAHLEALGIRDTGLQQIRRFLPSAS